jgi:predicted nucleic acid-binding protein
MYLLDSNIVSEFRKVPAGRANPGVVAWAQSVPPVSLFISAITLMELEKKVQSKARQDSVAGEILRRWMVEKVNPSFQGRVLAVDAAVALENAGYHVPDQRPLADSLIAATAKVHGLYVVTRNVKDFEPFKAHGLRVLNPWVEQPEGAKP